MSKTKKSKLLASMLCATVVAGLYAGPVMAEKLYVDSNNSVVTTDVDTTEITDLELSGKLTVGDKVLNSDTLGKVNNLFNSRATSAPAIYAGDGSKIGGVTFKAGSVTGVNNLTATGTITGNAITAKGRLTAYGGSSITAENTTKDKKVSSSVGATAVTDTLYTKVNDQYKVGASSSVGTTSIRDTVNKYDDNGNRIGTGSSSVSATGISNSVTKYDTDGKTVIGSASSAISGSGVTNTVTGNNDKKASSSVGLGTVTNTTYTYDAKSGKYVEAAKTYMSTTGITDTFKDGNNLITSKVDKNGVTNSYKDENGVTHSMVTNGSGTKFTGNTTANSTNFGSYNYSKIDGATATFGGSTNAKYGGQTVIKGGEITTDKVKTDELEIGNLAITEGANGGVSFGGTEFTVNDNGQIEVAGLNIENVQLDASGLKLGAAGSEVFTVDTVTGNLSTTGKIVADGDIVANGTSLLEVGTAVGDLTDKTAAVEDKTKNIRRIGNATIFSERVGINDRGLSIAADNGDTAIDITKEGNITAVGEIKGDNVYSANYDLETVGYNTQDISYENGKTTVGGVTFKDGFVDASVVKTHSIFFDGGTLSAGGISAVQGKFVVDENGSVKSFGDVQSANYSLEEIGKNLGDLETGVSADLSDLKQKTSTLTVIEDTPKGTITNISSHLNVQGDISANGDVTTKAGASLNGLNEQVKEDALKIHNLQVNTAGITRDGEVTTIEGATSFDADGMKMVGDNITDHVTINRNGSMEARNGDASFYFDKNSIALNNGNNSVMVGNESITLSTTGAALTMSKDGLDYADGAFKVAADGSVRIASGTENSITLDAKTGVIYANDFSTGEYSLNAIGDQLNELETGVGEDITDLKRKTTDIEYADGVTTIAGATKFTENGMQVGKTVINADGSIGAGNGNFTVTTDGEVIVRGENGATSITGDAITIGGTVITNGVITTDKAVIGGVDISNGRVDGVDVSELAGSVFDGSKDIAELQRITTGMDYQNGVTSFSGDITFRHNGDTVSLGGLVDKVNDIYDRTSGISKDENGNTVIDGGLVVDGGTTGTGGSITGNGDMNISGDGQIGGDLDVAGSVNAGNVNTGNINAGKGTIGGIHMENGEMTVGDTTVNGDGVNVGGENGTSITDKDVVINQGTDNEVSLSDVGNRVDNLEQGMASMSNRISKVEDRIDKVGAMSAAIANLRTMGYDPTAPTEIAVGIGQYRSETGAALGLFHYPNKDFMLSLSVSTSGDEVMGGIGATWKFGRKSPEQMLAAEKEKAAKAKLAKAEAMKKAAAEAKVAEQQAKHAKMAAEKAAK